MAKIDKIKETISLAKYALGILLGLIFAMTGWIVASYKTADSILIILTFILVAVFVNFSIMLLKFILNKIESLEEL
jgi:hypothetical protein